jgi:hypothetical protein
MPIAASVTPAAAKTLASVERTSNSSAASRGPESGAGRSHRQPRRATEHKVTICIDQPPIAHDLPRAELLASKMFRPVSVKLDWEVSCPAGDAIRMGLSSATSDNEHPGALAYAFPYEAVHIVVFYDRVNRSVSADLRALVLAHVLVHENAHVLEGVDRHSESGVMKAHWTETDYTHMRAKPLHFTDWDIQRIQKGLESRLVRFAERNVTAAVASPEQFR